MKNGIRNYNFTLSIICFIIMSTSLSSAQSMYYHTKNGATITYDLLNVSNMTFTSVNFNIRKTDGTTDSYLISNFGQIYFQFDPNLIPEFSANDRLIHVYPNPVHDLLNLTLIGDINQGASIQILNLEGDVLLIKQIINAGNYLFNMSNYPEGIYLCRYNNGTTITTEKIVKQ